MANKWNDEAMRRADAPLGSVDSDLGQWKALAFKKTDDKKYARAAIEHMLDFPMTEGAPNRGFWDAGCVNPNNLREYAGLYAVMHRLLEKQMTDDERLKSGGNLQRWGEAMAAFGSTGDTDAVLGYCTAVELIDATLGTSFCNSSNWRGMRATIQQHFEFAEGGEWIESGEMYNWGTIGMFLFAVAEIGWERYPEVAAWLPECAEQLRWVQTPDLADTFQWGDSERPHREGLWALTGLAGELLAKLDTMGMEHAEVRARLRQLLSLKLGDYVGKTWATNMYRPLWAGFDSDTLPAVGTFNYEHPQGLRTTAAGLTVYRRGEVAVAVAVPNDLEIDHVLQGCHFFAYEKGWVIDEPRGNSYRFQLGNHSRAWGFGRTRHCEFKVGELEGGTGFWLEWKAGGDMRGAWAGNNQPTQFIDEHFVRHEFDFASRTMTVVDRFKGRLPDREIKGGPGLLPEELDLIDSAKWVLERTQYRPDVMVTAIGDGGRQFMWPLPDGRTVKMSVEGPTEILQRSLRGTNPRGNYLDEELANHHELKYGMILAAEASGELSAEMTTRLSWVKAGVVLPPVDPPVDPPIDPPPPDDPPVDPVDPPAAPNGELLTELLKKARVRVNDGELQIFVPLR